MDNIFPIIEKNYPNSLSIITSDHGMNIDGNHGGSDEESLRVPLYFIARDLKSQEIHREIYNISIVPTLSAIFGIPIPNFSSAGPIYEIIDSDRRLDYLYESIDKKEKIIEVMEGIEARSFIMNKDLMESITNHDKELTERILDYKGRYIDNILMNQRIIAIILFILFIIWAIYKTESGIPLLLILSSLLPLLMGFSMDLINSRNVYDISIAIYLLSLSAIAFYYTLSFDNPILFDKRHPLATFLPLLSLLMIPNIIIAGFFIPFHTLSPDENIFAFRFFSISFIHPPLFLSLLVFMDWIKRESGGDIQEGVSLAPDEDEERDHSD